MAIKCSWEKSRSESGERGVLKVREEQRYENTQGPEEDITLTHWKKTRHVYSSTVLNYKSKVFYYSS